MLEVRAGEQEGGRWTGKQYSRMSLKVEMKYLVLRTQAGKVGERESTATQLTAHSLPNSNSRQAVEIVNFH